MEFFLKVFAMKRQLVSYCLIGMAGTVTDFGTFSVLVKWLGHTHYQIANVAGYGAGTLLSFAANAWWNFCIRDRLAVRFLTFCGVAFLGWALSANLLALFIGKLGWNVFLSKFISLFGVLLLQYNLNRWFTFRKIN